MKQHAIIEKTARFIATQGAQMEILIKAKQANNAQFDFLSQGGQLQPYYRHLLAAIKQGKYAPSTDAAQDNSAGVSSSNDGSSAATSPKRTQQVITVPTIKYKPSANCAYTQLISKIKGVPLQAVLDDEVGSQHSGGTASPTPSCKSEGQSQSSNTAGTTAGSTANGEFTPVLLQYNGSTFAHEEENANDAIPKVELLKNTSALALAQNYSSDSDDEDNDDEQETDDNNSNGQKQTKTATTNISTTKPPAELPPPPLLTFPLPEETLRHIIDKTATYVIKNGRQFEETLRTKSVERFNFLLPEHKFYPYYMYKITGDVDAASKEEKTRKAAAVAAALISKKGLNAGAAAATGATSAAAASSEKGEKIWVCLTFITIYFHAMQRPCASPFEYEMRMVLHCSPHCHRRLAMRMRMAREKHKRNVRACRTVCSVPSSRWKHSCWHEVEAQRHPQRQPCHSKSSVKVSANVSENDIRRMLI